MEVREHVPLASLTTLQAGGPARFVLSCTSVDEVRTALAFAKERSLPWYVLGIGSNVLAPDEGYDGVIILPRILGIAYESKGDTELLTSGSGVSWDDVVEDAAAHSLWGIENLAGIPGTMGAAPVQNIGAYGTELKDTFKYLDALDTKTGEVVRLDADACAFGYRESRFKKSTDLVILSVTLVLHHEGVAQTTYKDLAQAKEAGADIGTPAAVGTLVRAIRAKKFPDVTKEGTAGSFFKNPVISTSHYETLVSRYPDLPKFEAVQGVKVPLAYILDRVLNLRGFRKGRARLFEAQPLVLVLDTDGTSHDVEALARDVEEKVLNVTGIHIEREVRSLAK